VVDVAEYERLRRLERARAPSFADVLLSMPQANSPAVMFGFVT
jgi:hypothetical protein